MIPQERTVEPAMAPSPASSPYLSLRQAVRPAIFAHFLLAEDQERARQLAAECEDLLFLTRELLKAAGLADILGARAPSSSGKLDVQLRGRAVLPASARKPASRRAPSRR